jgi:hypothetical protein
VLDDVERRRFLVQPAGEDALVAAFAIANVELHESAGQLLHLPWRGRLAGAQAHDDIAGSRRLAGPQGELAHLAIALVEQPQGGDPLRHRRRAGREARHRLRDIDRLDLGRDGVAAIDFRRAGGTAGGQRGKCEKADLRPGHAPSGVQA